jgi:hypothetical protein
VDADEIALTMPGDGAYQRVAHLVLGGLATRHELTVETLDDLTLALDAVLGRYGAVEEDVTVRVHIGEDEIRTELGPFHHDDVADELSQRAGEGLDLRRILSAVCDDVAVSERDGAHWIELTKRLHLGEAGAR